MGTDSDGSGKGGFFSRMFGGGKAAEKSDISPAETVTAAPSEKVSWWSRLSGGLSRTSQSIVQGVADVFTKRKLDGAMLDELEDILIQADLGVAAAGRILAETLATRRMAALNRHALIDIQDWRNRDEEVVGELRKAMQANQAPSADRASGVYAAHVVAAAAVVKRLHDAFKDALFDAATQSVMDKFSMPTLYQDGAAFAADYKELEKVERENLGNASTRAATYKRIPHCARNDRGGVNCCW